MPSGGSTKWDATGDALANPGQDKAVRWFNFGNVTARHGVS